MNASTSPIVVCGFGIIGLTTAIRVLEAGYPVIALAAHLPGDPLVAMYASTAAGAHHLSFAADDDERQQALDRRTFDVMWEEEEKEGDSSALMKLRQVEFYGSEGEKHIKFFETMPDFRVYSQSELRPFAKHTVSFTSLTMDTMPYLTKLFQRFNALGGVIHRTTLTNFRDIFKYTGDHKPLAVINCTALGSLKLGLDNEMYPIRGQVVALNAPWVKEGRTHQIGNLAGGEGGERTYIIPRRSGQVIIGGTRETNDWNPNPVPETSFDIKRRALQIYPELVPPSLRKQGSVPVPEDLDSIVVRDVVGFRPARRSGLRLNRGDDLEGIPVFHNIGHSGAGWQSSWGCAEEIVRMLQQAICS